MLFLNIDDTDHVFAGVCRLSFAVVICLVDITIKQFIFLGASMLIDVLILVRAGNDGNPISSFDFGVQ